MLIELLRSAAQTAPTQPAIISPTGSVTYEECVSRSEALARGLHVRSIERFACMVDEVRELVALLCAASASGSEACVYPDTLDEQSIERLAQRLDHSVLVTDHSLALERPRPVILDGLAAHDSSLPPRPERTPALILTTGTTGHFKAARHDWARLVEATKRADEPPRARWLLAYNVHQFAAIQVVLHVLVNRATLAVPASRRATDIVAAIRDLGITHVSGTPTFWRLLLGALDPRVAETLPIQQITLGGEAVPEFLLVRLRGLFPRARISQIYGATEFGTSVSVRDEHSGLPASVLARGDDADVQFRIVDGQLHVRSHIGMDGYWGEKSVTAEWRPTGDLVEVRDDRIYFVGRAGDTINVGGVKVHPLPVEDRVAAVAGVQLGRAYGRSNPVTGQIVVLDVVPAAGADRAALEERIREACASLPPAARPRRIRFVDELDVRGHKIARVDATVTPE